MRSVPPHGPLNAPLPDDAESQGTRYAQPQGTRGRLRGESRAAYIARLCEPHVDNAIKSLVALSMNSSRDSVRKDASKDIVVLFADAQAEAEADSTGAKDNRVIYLVDADKAQELLSAQRASERKP
jgi:hypothetical protein